MVSSSNVTVIWIRGIDWNFQVWFDFFGEDIEPRLQLTIKFSAYLLQGAYWVFLRTLSSIICVLGWDGMRIFLYSIENLSDEAHCKEDLTAFASVAGDWKPRKTESIDNDFDAAAGEVMQLCQIITSRLISWDQWFKKQGDPPFENITAPGSSMKGVSLVLRTRGF